MRSVNVRPFMDMWPEPDGSLASLQQVPRSEEMSPDPVPKEVSGSFIYPQMLLWRLGLIKSQML